MQLAKQCTLPACTAADVALWCHALCARLDLSVLEQPCINSKILTALDKLLQCRASDWFHLYGTDIHKAAHNKNHMQTVTLPE